MHGKVSCAKTAHKRTYMNNRKLFGCGMQLVFIVTARSGEHCLGWVVQVQALSQDSAPATVPVARAHLCCPLQQRGQHQGGLQPGEMLVNTAWWFEASRKRVEQ